MHGCNDSNCYLNFFFIKKYLFLLVCLSSVSDQFIFSIFSVSDTLTCLCLFSYAQCQFIIRILSVSETLSCLHKFYISLLLVYFLDIFGIWSCTCMFLEGKYLKFIWYHLILLYFFNALLYNKRREIFFLIFKILYVLFLWFMTIIQTLLLPTYIFILQRGEHF